MKKKQILLMFILIALALVLIVLGINNKQNSDNSLNTKEESSKIKDYKYNDLLLSDIKIEKKKGKTIVIGTVVNNSDNKYDDLYLKVTIVTKKKNYDSYISLSGLEANGGLGIRIEYIGNIKSIESVTIGNATEEEFNKFLNNNE